MQRKREQPKLEVALAAAAERTAVADSGAADDARCLALQYQRSQWPVASLVAPETRPEKWRRKGY